MNNSRGAGTAVDSQAVSGTDGGEEEIDRRMNSNQTLFLNGARVGGINNAIAKYDNTNANAINAMFAAGREIQQAVQDITAVNEFMTGTQGGQRQLVGVLNSQIERGTLVQEPFYFGLGRVILQVYQSVTAVGKRVYLDNPRRLAIIAGDDGAKRINLRPELALEDFRVFIKRTANEDSAQGEANNLLMTLVQMGFINPDMFANLWNRANVEEIARSMREYHKDLAEARRKESEANAVAEEQQNQQLQQAVQVAEAEDEENKSREDRFRREDAADEIDKIKARGEEQRLGNQSKTAGQLQLVNANANANERSAKKNE